MKKNFLTLLSCFLLFAAYGQQDKHVILVTIDGFRPDFYLESTWPTPHLHAMMKEGIYSRGVTSVFPSMTYPSHTTIVTGVQPAAHGIFYNGMFESENPTGKIYWNFHQIKSPTVWEAAKSAGLKVATLMWPVSAEAPADFNLSDVGSMGKTTLEKYATPKGVLATIAQDVFNGSSDFSWGKDQNVAKVAAWVIKNQKPNLMTIHLFSVDHAEHITGRQGDMVKEAVADADSSVAMIRQAIGEAGLKDHTLFIVTGDHGFNDVSMNLNPNVWLARAGLLSDPASGNWKAQFHSVGGAAFLFLRKEGDRETLNRVVKVLADLPAEEKKYFRIISKSEMNKVGADPHAVLAISGINGGAFTNKYTGESMGPRKGGAHGYFPDERNLQTGFIAVGPSVKGNVEIGTMNLRDVTSFIRDFLGLKMPSSQGKPAGRYLNGGR